MHIYVFMCWEHPERYKQKGHKIMAANSQKNAKPPTTSGAAIQ